MINMTKILDSYLYFYDEYGKEPNVLRMSKETRKDLLNVVMPYIAHSKDSILWVLGMRIELDSSIKYGDVQPCFIDYNNIGGMTVVK